MPNQQTLAVIFNESLNSWGVADIWKLKNVTKGDTTLPVNYRPISLTSIIGELMETIIRDKLVNFLDENIMIDNYQS